MECPSYMSLRLCCYYRNDKVLKEHININLKWGRGEVHYCQSCCRKSIFSNQPIVSINLYLQEWCWTEFLQVCWNSHGVDGPHRWWSPVWWSGWRGCLSSGCLRTFWTKSKTFTAVLLTLHHNINNTSHETGCQKVLLARHECVLISNSVSNLFTFSVFFPLNEIYLHPK